MPTTTHTATAYDWLTGTDVVRLALAAYYGACRISDTQQDADPVTDCQRLGFGERLAQLFEFKVLAHGHRTGVEGFPPWPRRVSSPAARSISRNTRRNSESTSYALRTALRRPQ